ncbi:MAG TPA: YhjD/YihY/BrkB family envelope integrity protein [Verrucomicrobiae bacterium]|nr:YhjD/YihY/BrkB family envelope integrity protein [Verrucomicrobiae bacterium]
MTGIHTGAEGELSRLERFVHFWALAVRSFVRNRCPVRAAALSYTSLLALIPLLAVAIGVTSSLLKSEGEEKIYQAIDKFVGDIVPPAGSTTNAPPVSTKLSSGVPVASGPTNLEATVAPTNFVAETNQTVAATGGDDWAVNTQKKAARSIREFIQTTRSGTLGVAGTVLLIFVVFALLGRIEETMNDVWGVSRSRNWLTRIEHYWFAIGLVPTLLVAGLILASGPRFAGVRHFVESMPLVSGVVFNFFPLVLLWLAFAFFYKIMPNTRVCFNAALVGGIVGGSLWYLNNVFGFLYVSRVVSNSKIYGSLGLVPVFMIGLYFSWLILLFGAQVAYAFQNRSVYLQEKLAENVNQRGREFIALRLMTGIGQRFQRGLPPATIQEISTELGVPSRLAQQILQTLLAARLVTEVGGAEGAYVPARPLESINAYQILYAMRTGAGQELPMRDEPARAEVYGEFARIEEAERQAASSVTMLALVNRAHARLEIAAPRSEAERPVLTAEAKTKMEDRGLRMETAAPGQTPSSILDSPSSPPSPGVPPPATTVPPAEKRAVVMPDEDRGFPL